ncbi:MAG: sigma-70 family RNA polymerase sigma factor [Candidatus Sumerlaeota bacterium]|nr:sigma-70 family RNA polymerase sigma factor [Candidatus Sumerlaeota bacterium]
MMAGQETDAELIEASLGGNREAFGRIVERYQNLVCSIAYGSVGNFDLSEDLAQETFVTAWRQLGQLRDRMRFRFWLVGIVRNLIRNYHRKDSKDLISAAAPLEDDDGSTVSERITPREEAISHEQQTILWNALEAIPIIYREPLILYYREGQSIRQVAEALDLGQEAVKSRIHRGRAMLKEEVNRFVEGTLNATRPNKVFTAAVVAALPGTAYQVAAASAAGGSMAKGSGAVLTGLGSALWGAMLTPILGILMLVYGAMANVAHTFSVRERRLVFWMTWGCVAVAVAFLVGLGRLVRRIEQSGSSPGSSRLLILYYSLVFLVVLTVMIIYAERRQRRIRIEDGASVDSCRQAPAAAVGRRLGISARMSYGGITIGGMAWLLAVTWFLKDWLTFGLTFAVTAGLCIQAIARAARAPQRYYSIMTQTIFIMMLYALIIFNLRWNLWLEAIQHRGFDLNMIAIRENPGRWGFNAIIIALYIFIWQRWVWTSRRVRPQQP